MKNLIMGALALVSIAGAAGAGQAFDSSAGQPATLSTEPNLLSRGAVDISKRSVDPAIFDPSHATPRRADSGNAPTIPNSEPSRINQTVTVAQPVADYRRTTIK